MTVEKKEKEDIQETKKPESEQATGKENEVSIAHPRQDKPSQSKPASQKQQMPSSARPPSHPDKDNRPAGETSPGASPNQQKRDTSPNGATPDTQVKSAQQRPSHTSQQSGGTEQQRSPGGSKQGTPPKHGIDWLRSKPVSSGQHPSAPQRGLDLGRPGAWSGKQKPPKVSPSGQRSGEQQPARSAGTETMPRPSQTGTSEQTPQSRPSAPRPASSAPRRPLYGLTPTPAPDWVRGSEPSRRIRSARKAKTKEKPIHDDEIIEELEDRRGGAATARAASLRPQAPKGKPEPAGPEASKAIAIPSRVAVKELADLLGISSVEIIKELMKNGIMAPINQVIDFDTASIVASDLGFEVRPMEVPEAEAVATAAPAPVPAPSPKRIALIEQEDPKQLVPRPPVVTIMGHVDHGKTTLLDAIRRTNVAAEEYGNITQHIGAYQVEEKDKKITFLDTPGHEAFTAMRARGAQVTDIAVVVVAADDGVQPQTIEAINHARAANVPIVVALNKIDKETANPERVKQQLAEAGLVPEEWGGSTVVVPVSAKTGQGVSDLLDMILLVAEMADLKANPNRSAVGTIIEAEMDKTRGPMATVLVQNGTLKVGDYVVVGTIYGKVRAMFNDRGKPIRKAPPSTPVSILGLSDVPQSGDILEVLPSEREARALANERLEKKQREAATVAPPTVDLERLSEMIAAGEVKELGIVLKVDVHGSLEPIVSTLQKLSDAKENVKIRFLHQAIGMITESDVMLAAASRSVSASKAAMVIGFNVEPDAAAKRTADMLGVEIRTFKVIYDLVDAIEKALKGLYEPEFTEVIDGRAEVRQIFKLGRGLVVAGSVVTDGTITRGAQSRVRRNGDIVFEGKIGSLRRFKDDVREVTAGLECGITLEGFNDIQEKDIIETYHKERVN